MLAHLRKKRAEIQVCTLHSGKKSHAAAAHRRIHAPLCLPDFGIYHATLTMLRTSRAVQWKRAVQKVPMKLSEQPAVLQFSGPFSDTAAQCEALLPAQLEILLFAHMYLKPQREPCFCSAKKTGFLFHAVSLQESRSSL